MEGILVSMDNGNVQKAVGLSPNERVLGWTGDDQIYVASAVSSNRAAIHVEKLNPRTGVRTAWRDLAMPPLGGIVPDPPIITPDGATYGFDYRLRLSDLYTVNGVH